MPLLHPFLLERGQLHLLFLSVSADELVLGAQFANTLVLLEDNLVLSPVGLQLDAQLLNLLSEVLDLPLVNFLISTLLLVDIGLVEILLCVVAFVHVIWQIDSEQQLLP